MLVIIQVIGKITTRTQRSRRKNSSIFYSKPEQSYYSKSNYSSKDDRLVWLEERGNMLEENRFMAKWFKWPLYLPGSLNAMKPWQHNNSFKPKLHKKKRKSLSDICYTYIKKTYHCLFVLFWFYAFYSQDFLWGWTIENYFSSFILLFHSPNMQLAVTFPFLLHLPILPREYYPNHTQHWAALVAFICKHRIFIHFWVLGTLKEVRHNLN